MGGPPSLRILYVGSGDSEGLAALERRASGLEVRTERDGEGARAALREGSFDCVVSEYRLPGSDGLELLRSVRNAHPHLPLVLFTAERDVSLAERALDAGIDEFVRRSGDGLGARLLVKRVRDLTAGLERADLEWGRQHFRQLVEQSLVGIYIVQDGAIVYANETVADVFGYTPTEMIGMEPVEFVASEDWDRVRENLRKRLHGDVEGTRYSFTGRRKDGEAVEVEVHGGRIVYEGEPAVMGALVDVTEQRESRRQLVERTERLAGVLRRMSDAFYAVDDEWRVTYWNERMADRTGVPAEEALGEPVFEVLDDFRGTEMYARFERALRTQKPATFETYREPLDARVEVRAYPSEDGLSVFSRDVSERKRRERRLKTMHETTARMLALDSADEVTAVASEAAADILGIPLNTVFLYDERADALVPSSTVRAADGLDAVPTFERGEGIAWQVYETGEPRAFPDVREADDVYNPETPIRSEVLLPLGHHGVFVAGSTEPDDFDETDVSLARILAANTEAVLDRIENEELLRERERETRRHTEQLEFFSSLLRHDVLNAITVIRGHAELLATDLDGGSRGDPETIVEWSDHVTGLVERVRQVIEAISEDADTPQSVDVTAVLADELARFRRAYSDVTLTADLPDGAVYVRGDDLLGEVVGNVLTNAVEHGGGETSRIAVSTTVDDDAVTVRIADDGPGIPEAEREAVFRRGETGHVKHAGSGFGLFFVDTMVSIYGGDVHVETADLGGAAVVIDLPRAAAEPAEPDLYTHP